MKTLRIFLAMLLLVLPFSVNASANENHEEDLMYASSEYMDESADMASSSWEEVGEYYEPTAEEENADQSIAY